MKRLVLKFAAIFALGFCSLWAVVPVTATASEADDDAKNLLDEWEQQKKPLKKKAAPQAKFIVGVVEAIGGAFAALTGADNGAGDAPVVVPPAIDLVPFEQQIKPQVMQVQAAELRFVQSVCRPTPAEFKTIKSATDAAAKSVIKECASFQLQMQQGFQHGRQPQCPDPRKIIVSELSKSVASTLSADRAKAYQEELEKRAAARKRAALLNMVAQLDQELVLSTEQRIKLTETLNANWNDSWGRQAEYFLYGSQYLPILPSERILPLLNKSQQEIWGRLPKNDFVGADFGFGFGIAQPVDFDGLNTVDEVPREATDSKDADAAKADGDKP